MVAEMSGFGLSQSEISHCLNAAHGGGYSVDTLQRHYREELDTGLAVQKHALVKRSIRMAMSEEVPAGVDPNEMLKEAGRMLRWVLPTVFGMKETIAHEHTGKDGGPIEQTINAANEFTSRITRLASRGSEAGGTSEDDA